jgi:phosphoglycolate phosphatase
MEPDPRRLAAVLFDLDGTLIDSVPDIALVLNRRLTALGRPRLPDRAVAKLMGISPEALVEGALLLTGGVEGVDVAATIADFRAEYGTHESTLTTVYPGALAALDALGRRGIKRGICTNKPRAATDKVLARFDLASRFEAIVGADEAPRRKPDPAHPLAVLHLLGEPATAAAFVGDSEIDAAAAAATDLPFVLCGFGYARGDRSLIAAALRIDHYDALLPGLARITTA